MGGVLVNGCGAADTCKKLVKLKVERCSKCRKEQEFYLAKVQMKIHVVFIPTLPLNTKYGIVCGKCKSGIIISEKQMHQLMCADERTRELLFDEIMNVGNPAEGPGTAPDHEMQAIAASDSGVKCPQCSKINPAGACFCGYCGAKIDIPMVEDQKESCAADTLQEAKTRLCPCCSGVNPAQARFCGHCGAKMEILLTKAAQSVYTEQTIQKNTSAIQAGKALNQTEKAGTWVCPLCGEKNSEGESICYLCGQKRK